MPYLLVPTLVPYSNIYPGGKKTDRKPEHIFWRVRRVGIYTKRAPKFFEEFFRRVNFPLSSQNFMLEVLIASH